MFTEEIEAVGLITLALNVWCCEELRVQNVEVTLSKILSDCWSRLSLSSLDPSKCFPGVFCSSATHCLCTVGCFQNR